MTALARAAACAAILAGPAAADCRLALALGLDVSGSVDEQEYRLQRDGLTLALLSPEVQSAFLEVPGTHVELYVFEWSGPLTQDTVAEWAEVRAPEDLERLAATLRGPGGPRHDPSTAIGPALVHGGRQAQGRDCWRRVVDLSGDGPANSGPPPLTVETPLAGVTVNGLVIGTQEMDYGGTREQNAGELARYYHREVIRGSGAFVIIALGFEDFRRAMELKLLREVQTLPAAGLTEN